MNFRSMVIPKNTNRLIFTGEKNEIKALADKLVEKQGVKVTCRRLTSYRNQQIYRVWVS
ncbi:MAG: hypothetical protein ACREV6_02135 [Clostridium sp.]|uniref:hypothetical protein n=1 Tax=Clostridium sp. TaxID=1506 RepID=UPI003D6CC824